MKRSAALRTPDTVFDTTARENRRVLVENAADIQKPRHRAVPLTWEQQWCCDRATD